MTPEEDRRVRKKDDLSIIVTGNKVPLTIFVSATVGLVASIVYATIWITKLDDRVYDNTGNIATNTALIKEVQDVTEEMQHSMIILQNNNERQTEILKSMVRRMETMEKFERGHHVELQ